MEPHGRPLDERRVRSLCSGASPAGPGIEELISLSPSELGNWMESRARLADGLPSGAVIVSPTTLLPLPGISSGTERDDPPSPEEPCLPAGLLREACGLGRREIAAHLGSTVTRAQRACARYHEAVRESREFAEEAARILRRALAADHVALPPGWSMGW